jgi:predicted esterase
MLLTRRQKFLISLILGVPPSASFQGLSTLKRSKRSFLSRWAGASATSDSNQLRRFVGKCAALGSVGGVVDQSLCDSSLAAPNMTRMLKVLALHGSEGSGPDFAASIQQWHTSLLECTASTNAPPPWDLDISAAQGPCAGKKGYTWWTMPPGVRSFQATAYAGFEQSTHVVETAWQQHEPDLVIGHSQGAILTMALLATRQIPLQHPSIGYILNGVAWPNPYTAELDALQYASATAPRVLLLIGERDGINPPGQARRVQEALERAGARVTAIVHAGGHSLPITRGPGKEEAYNVTDHVFRWIQEGLLQDLPPT